jgi:hypothetical protein
VSSLAQSHHATDNGTTNSRYLPLHAHILYSQFWSRSDPPCCRQRRRRRRRHRRCQRSIKRLERNPKTNGWLTMSTIIDDQIRRDQPSAQSELLAVDWFEPVQLHRWLRQKEEGMLNTVNVCHSILVQRGRLHNCESGLRAASEQGSTQQSLSASKAAAVLEHAVLLQISTLWLVRRYRQCALQERIQFLNSSCGCCCSCSGDV